MKKNLVDKVNYLIAATGAAVLMSCAGSVPELAPEPQEPATQANTETNLSSVELVLESSSSNVPAAEILSQNAEPSLEKMVESESESVAKTLAESPTPDTIVSKVSFFAIGDILFHTPLFEACKKDESKCNFEAIFKNWKRDIESADIAAVNQETIFVSRESGYSSYPAFGTPEQVGDAELAVGFDIVTHATNHTIDRGAKSVDYTIDYWNSKGEAAPLVLGIHKTADDQNTIAYREKNGIKFAFFNNTYGLNGQKMPDDRQYLVDMQDSTDSWLGPISEADKNADVVVVFMHVGTEYVPLPSEEAQQKVAKAIDAGADIVVCAHPHVVEPYGILTTKKGNSGLVYWSLGNFISNQSKNPTLLGGVAKFVVQKTEIGEAKTFQVTSAIFEGSVTHWDENGYIAIPLKDYSEKLAKKHAGKKADFNEIQKLFLEANEDYAKCGLEKVSEKLPLTVGPLRVKPTN